MTDDKITITRRIVLVKDYEFYENVTTSSDTSIENQKKIIADQEEMVQHIKEIMGTPSPEISTKTFTPGTDLIDALHKAYLDPDLVEFIAPNIIKLKGYLKDKDKWNKYNGVFRDAGYKWVSADKDSRWEK